MKPLVLCYHGVADAWEHQLAVTTAAFESQLRSLVSRGYRPVPAADTLSRNGRVVHVTFDDAYANVAAVVPLMDRFRIQATVFVCSGYAADGRPLDVPEVASAAAAAPEHMATMTWDALRDLAEHGIEIGSHTVSHAHLTKLTDDELDRELRDSRAAVEDELGRPCKFLAYPYGDDDERVYRATERAGYAGAFSLRGGARESDPFAIPRVDIYRRDSPLRFGLKTSALRRPAVAAASALRSLRR